MKQQQKPLWFVAAGCYDIGDDDCPTPMRGAFVRSVNDDGAYRIFKRLCKKRGLAVWNLLYLDPLKQDEQGRLYHADDGVPISVADITKILGEENILAVQI